jgi:hypothetical protein
LLSTKQRRIVFTTPTKSPPASSHVASKQQQQQPPRLPSLSPTLLSFGSDHDDEANKPFPLLRMYFGIVVSLMLSALGKKEQTYREHISYQLSISLCDKTRLDESNHGSAKKSSSL